jgi:acyl-CoA synthetase (AMP-forming)/AMP-acid ligase II
MAIEEHSMDRAYSDFQTEPPEVSTLVKLLRWRALQQPEQLAYIFLVDGEMKETRLTYGELDQKARAIGAFLQSSQAAGERALLLYPPGLDYIAAFFGCLYAGVIAVPAYPPRPSRVRSLSRIQTIVNDCGPAFALTIGPMQLMLKSIAARNSDFQALK